ncbi:LPXTG cell wall anchor domain-containing protein [Enterococcus casseliflavus]|uniref:LPXTG cell wall anchor domain-containing protein n=2 Tax=Enterococcus casseliflavus TaxID=37734 RepID=UPI003D6A4DB6
MKRCKIYSIGTMLLEVLEKGYGNVESVIEVELDTTDSVGHDLTFFELVDVDGQLVYKMHDKNATSETVHVIPPTDTPPSSSPKKNLPHTGEESLWWFVGVGALLVAGSLAFIGRHKISKVFLSLS